MTALDSSGSRPASCSAWSTMRSSASARVVSCRPRPAARSRARKNSSAMLSAVSTARPTVSLDGDASAADRHLAVDVGRQLLHVGRRQRRPDRIPLAVDVDVDDARVGHGAGSRLHGAAARRLRTRHAAPTEPCAPYKPCAPGTLSQRFSASSCCEHLRDARPDLIALVAQRRRARAPRLRRRSTRAVQRLDLALQPRVVFDDARLFAAQAADDADEQLDFFFEAIDRFECRWGLPSSSS